MALYAKCSLGLLLMLVICEVSYGRVHPAQRNYSSHRLQAREFTVGPLEAREFTAGPLEAREFTAGPLQAREVTEGPSDEEELTKTEATSKLLNDIFSYSHRHSNPIVEGQSVSVGMAYLCGRLNEQEHVLTSRAWARVQWRDPRLQWNPSEYNGIREVHVDPWYIWTPDLSLYNAVESPNIDWWVNAVVDHNGTIFYVIPMTFKTVCRPSKAGRSHQCTLKTGSWTYDSSLMPLKLLRNGFDNRIELEDCPYTISNVHSTIDSQKYECCEHPYQTFTSTFTIQPNNYD